MLLKAFCVVTLCVYICMYVLTHFCDIQTYYYVLHIYCSHKCYTLHICVHTTYTHHTTAAKETSKWARLTAESQGEVIHSSSQVKIGTAIKFQPETLVTSSEQL